MDKLKKPLFNVLSLCYYCILLQYINALYSPFIVTVWLLSLSFPIISLSLHTTYSYMTVFPFFKMGFSFTICTQSMEYLEEAKPYIY